MMQLPLAFFGMPGTWEWLVILVIALLLFGKRLPEIARSLGKGITEFKKGLHDVKDEVMQEEIAKDDAAPTLEDSTDAGPPAGDNDKA